LNLAIAQTNKNMLTKNDPAENGPKETAWLEAFCDGVFAIAHKKKKSKITKHTPGKQQRI